MAFFLANLLFLGGLPTMELGLRAEREHLMATSSSKPFYDMSNAELVQWTLNAISQATSYDEILFSGGAPELAAFVSAGTAFVNAQAAQIEAEVAAKNATQAKNEAKQSWMDLVKPYNNSWQINPAVTTEVRSKLQLPVRSGPGSISAPTTPTEVIATPFANGSLRLKWNRNGNSANTTFIVERLMGETWAGVFATMATKGTLSGFAPGVPAILRIRAVKGQVSSAPSNTVAIYTEFENGQLQLAA